MINIIYILEKRIKVCIFYRLLYGLIFLFVLWGCNNNLWSVIGVLIL